MFTSIAHAMGAQPGGQAAAPDGIAGLLAGPLPMLILMFAIFYFLLIRPQQKKAKQHKEMLAALKVGDKVMTGGGFYGRIKAIDQDVLTVELSENVEVKLNRGYIAGPSDTK
ncbi:preprotein translocase subunit YajC [Paucidesulfovibrio gracilis DSM 16080]|uniref:Sec translocon accessory complex subunit YajC n=2 Tax=Paucidesulfovibrio TaxID=2910985 RepID=A0A1T4WP59_9BACT|nr:preprotein translocase subunit YajC [Paucidesulfovibrio gracilis DSM 16080]